MSTHHGHLAYFLSRFVAHGRQDVHARRISGPQGQARYEPRNGKIGPEEIRRHLMSDYPLGMYLVEGHLVRAAVLDLDDHDGSVGWSGVLPIAQRLSDELRAVGLRPYLCRSGGGQGVHIWIVWKDPQDARAVRATLREVLELVGLQSGTEGLSKSRVEIYPKQDRVEAGKFGNLIALPFSRASAPLADDLSIIELAEYQTPLFESLYSEPVGQYTEIEKSDAFGPLPIDEEDVSAALQKIPADDHDLWIRIGLGIKNTFGNDGFDLWDAWSAKAANYPGKTVCEGRWRTFPDTSKVGIGTIFYFAQQNGWNGPSNQTVRSMNSRFGILTHGNKTLIILKNGDRKPDDEFTWLSKEAFVDRLKTEPMRDSSGGEGTKDKAKFWMSHRLAAHYHRLDFDPSLPVGHNGKVWNLWTGFAVKPVPGSWSLLQDHIRTNICQCDAILYQWLINWMAMGVQRPSYVIGTAPVLKGYPGTGKGVLANAYGKLWGRHFVAITNEEQVTGRFNAHLAGKRLIFIDEGTFGGDRRKAGVLKTRVTEDWIMLEAKGIDPIRMRNWMIFMIASNEESIVPADRADRRWQLFPVGDTHRADRGYFRAIFQQLETGGYEAMLYDLLHANVNEGPDPCVTIKTDELFYQVIQAAPVELKYLHQILDAGTLPQNAVAGPSSSTIRALLEDLKRSFPTQRYPSDVSLGRFLKSTFPGIHTHVAGKFRLPSPDNRPTFERSTRYDFPDLSACRIAFERVVGQRVPWSATTLDWQSDDDIPI